MFKICLISPQNIFPKVLKNQNCFVADVMFMFSLSEVVLALELSGEAIFAQSLSLSLSYY